MILPHSLALAVLSLVGFATAQTDEAPFVYDDVHNATTIVGTWSSGSKNVLTGSGFANPANMTFTYPTTTGVSYSFTEDNYYEIARYRFNANGSDPNCITGVVVWVHGTVTFNSNGSLTMTPMGDGFQQVQDPCAAVSNFVEVYNYTELFVNWRIFQDPVDGYKLHLFQFDGQPVAPMFQVSTTPIMLPTQLLRNSTASTVERRELVVEKRNGDVVSTRNVGVSMGFAAIAAGLLSLVL